MKKLLVVLALCGLCVGSVQASDFVPAATGTQSLGQSLLQWLNGYFVNLYVTNATVATGGTLTIPASGLVLPANSVVATVTATCATNANGGTNVWTFTGKDFAGTTVTSPFVFTMFVSTTAEGDPADTLTELAVTSGSLIKEVTADALEIVASTNGAAGSVVLTLTQTPGLTNYVTAVSPVGFKKQYVNAFNIP